MGQPLYFVTISTERHGTLMGGHWYAWTAKDAKDIAKARYEEDRASFPHRAHLPHVSECIVKARTSTSYVNALNNPEEG